MKNKLIEKLMERIADLDPMERLELVGIHNIDELIDMVIETELNKLTEDQILDLI